MEKHEHQRIVLASIISAVVSAVVIGSGFLWIVQHKPELFARVWGETATQTEEKKTGFLYPAEANVVETVKKANPAVVAITISKNMPVYEQSSDNIQHPFGDLFGNDFFFNIPQMKQKGTQKQDVGGGSGFLVSQDGYIVTNRHVVDDESAEYTVLTSDGKKYPAKVIARDPVLDLAVIKISGSGFPHLSFGDSDAMQVGQSVIAIGNALAEFRNTVSVGVVSGLSRSIVASTGMDGGAESLDQLIQTDAAINPGNSGGPLLNLSGDVIGVNVAVAGGAQNIGFAITSNSVRSIVDSVRQTGKIVRPYIGVRYTQITDELKKKNNLSVDYGVLVQRGKDSSELAVIPGSPADKAGIVENDIILEINGVKLTSDQNFSAMVRAKKAGDSITLKVLSKGKEKTVTVTLEALKS